MHQEDPDILPVHVCNPQGVCDHGLLLELSVEKLEKSLNKLKNNADGHVWIGGDFNFPGIDWKNNTIKEKCSQPELSRKFRNIMEDHSLTQVVEEPTFHKNTLDLFFTNNPTRVYNTKVIPGISLDGHHAVYIELDITPIRNKQIPRKIKQYARADWTSFKSFMSETCKDLLQKHSINSPVEVLWTEFKGKLEEGLAKFVPEKTAKTRDGLPWVNKTIKKLLRKQKKLFLKQKGCCKETRASKNYRTHKAYVQREIRRAYWTYVSNIITDEEDTNNKKFWRHVKHKKQDNQGVAPLKENGLLYSDSTAKANILNKQFTKVFSKKSPLSLSQTCKKVLWDTKHDKPDHEMDPFLITEEGVKKLLLKLNPNKACGPDKIRPLLLKELAVEITPIVTLIFNCSYQQQQVPSDWKTAYVTPIFKKGEKYEASNYRPVSLTCVLCKTMEHIIASRIMSHLNKHDLLYKYQNGFSSKLSTETQLLEFVTNMINGMKDGNQNDVVVMDFAKAFDKVSHQKLIFKLRKYGIDEKTCSWAQSFLSQRSQRVVVEGSYSDEGQVTSGVPQGSVVGPIFFSDLH